MNRIHYIDKHQEALNTATAELKARRESGSREVDLMIVIVDRETTATLLSVENHFSVAVGALASAQHDLLMRAYDKEAE